MSEINYDNDDENGGWGMGMNAKNNNLKLRYLFTPQRQDSDQESHECPDLDFIYDDADTLANEIAEIYSYSEQPEFRLNVKAFEDNMETMNLRPAWGNISEKQKRAIISTLQDNLDVSDKTLRTSTARCFLYLLQGCWAECQSDVEQQTYAKENVLLLYNCGVFTSFLELFLFEIDVSSVAVQRKVAVNISDSIDLRIILTVVYIFVEIIRNIGENDSSEFQKLKREFHEEVFDPIGDELLTIKLFGMVTRYCSGTSPHYPIKKVLLVIWKLILFTLGGTEKLKQMKLEARAQAGLEKFVENTVDIVKTMRACTPPIGGFYDKGDERPAGNRFDMKRRRNLVKQSSLDDESDAIYCPSMEEDIGMDFPMQPEAPSVAAPPAKGLPWAPKIRQKDLDAFLENVRLKFVGFTIPNDRETLIGLPSPICEGISVLKRYVYRSLADIQIEKEENILKYPLTQSEGEIPLNSTEILYRAMLPGMQQTIIALLKILLAAAPTSKTKTDSINIMADVLPEEMPITVLQSKKLGTDVSRHKEIIVKAISGILLLLLKHCKLNHVYQFEFLSQFLVFANCIPLVLKFFNQNIISYVAAKNIIPILEFPACVIDDPPDPTAENLLIGESQQCCWRNVFSCINLLRILNKVTKWKHSRIMMIVVFKSAPILRRTLKVRHAMMQLYVLKLLKMQTKYLGRQWRKSNMKTMSAIYTKVRHRLNDDWAFGNDLDARPWDFQAEECSLRSSVDKFNSRRYHADYCFDWDYYPINYNVIEELAREVDLTDEFKQHYEIWLNQEVFAKTIDWDEVLSATGLPKTLDHA